MEIAVTVADDLRIEHPGVLEHRRPGPEVLSGQIEAYLLEMSLFDNLLRKTVVEGQGLQTDISRILEISVIRECEGTCSTVGSSVGLARPIRVL